MALCATKLRLSLSALSQARLRATMYNYRALCRDTVFADAAAYMTGSHQSVR